MRVGLKAACDGLAFAAMLTEVAGLVADLVAGLMALAWIRPPEPLTAVMGTSIRASVIAVAPAAATPSAT
jgi:hypothetical protein